MWFKKNKQPKVQNAVVSTRRKNICSKSAGNARNKLQESLDFDRFLSNFLLAQIDLNVVLQR